MDHVDLLTKFRIIPVSVVELDITDEEMLRRANIDRSSQDRFVYFINLIDAYMYVYLCT